MPTVRTYLLLAAAEFQRYSTYRLAILPVSRPSQSWVHPRSASSSQRSPGRQACLAGYDQALRLDLRLARPGAAGADCDLRVDRACRAGQQWRDAVDFARPVDLQLAWWARDFGRASFQLLRGPPPLLIGAVTIRPCASQSWTAYPLGLVISWPRR